SVLSLADWVVNRDDGRLALLGLVDNGPTGLASATTEACYHGPGRGSGNSINALLDAWLLSGQRSYLSHAETLIQRCVHPRDDIAAKELLNAELRWSYTVFLSVLARYLNIKVEAAQLDSTYSYARASLVHYACWMLDNERPYFDHPEALEFPTETWAAQEFRKANVLRLAAALAQPALRSRFLGRALELSERAWSDLLRFESCFSARAFAILMIEGLKDSIFRAFGPACLPEASVEPEFG